MGGEGVNTHILLQKKHRHLSLWNHIYIFILTGDTILKLLYFLFFWKFSSSFFLFSRSDVKLRSQICTVGRSIAKNIYDNGGQTDKLEAGNPKLILKLDWFVNRSLFHVVFIRQAAFFSLKTCLLIWIFLSTIQKFHPVSKIQFADNSKYVP